MDLDAIIVGAGPAGTAAAIQLARNKRRVLLLDRCTFPRDKSCGDALTQSAVCVLNELGVLQDLPTASRISGGRIFLRGQGYRDFRYPQRPHVPSFGLVIRRLELDDILCRRAVAAGAEFRQGAEVKQLLYDDGRVVGVEVEHGGISTQVYARAVVVATGAASKLAAPSGLVPASSSYMGFAIRGYYSGAHDLTDLLEIYIPIFDGTDRYLIPSYGWVFPTGGDTVNIGVGIFRRMRAANVRRMMERFLVSLAEEHSRFRGLKECGPWHGAPLRFDFSPERCVAEGLLLAGDAAGLVSPFTGEGIGYALESGKLAAKAIHESLQKDLLGRPDLSAYSTLLAEWHSGYFEAGRKTARRYSLIWQVLEDTFHNERPLFSLCRRAALFPEGFAEPIDLATVEDVSPLMHAPIYRLQNDLKSVNTLVMDTIRQEWPVLAQLKLPSEREMGVLFRPALLALLSYYAGAGNEERAILSASAIELGYFAATAYSSVSDDVPQSSIAAHPERLNFGNFFSLGLGDFLMSKALEMSARVGPTISTAMSKALAVMAEARVRERHFAHRFDLPLDEQVHLIGRKTAMFFVLPCRLGAMCGSLPEAQVAALASYGRELGIAYHLVDDLLAMTGKGETLGGTGNMDLADGIYSVAVRSAAREESEAATQLRNLLAAASLSAENITEVQRLVRETGAITTVFEAATEAKDRAQKALSGLPGGRIRRALRGLASSAVKRAKA